MMMRKMAMALTLVTMGKQQQPYWMLAGEPDIVESG